MATGKRGRPRKRVDQKAVSVRFESELHARLAIVAAARGVSLNDLVTTALEVWLRTQPEASSAARLQRAAQRRPSGG